MRPSPSSSSLASAGRGRNSRKSSRDLRTTVRPDSPPPLSSSRRRSRTPSGHAQLRRSDDVGLEYTSQLRGLDDRWAEMRSGGRGGQENGVAYRAHKAVERYERSIDEGRRSSGSRRRSRTASNGSTETSSGSRTRRPAPAPTMQQLQEQETEMEKAFNNLMAEMDVSDLDGDDYEGDTEAADPQARRKSRKASAGSSRDLNKKRTSEDARSRTKAKPAHETPLVGLGSPFLSPPAPRNDGSFGAAHAAGLGIGVLPSPPLASTSPVSGPSPRSEGSFVSPQPIAFPTPDGRVSPHHQTTTPAPNAPLLGRRFDRSDGSGVEHFERLPELDPHYLSPVQQGRAPLESPSSASHFTTASEGPVSPHTDEPRSQQSLAFAPVPVISQPAPPAKPMDPAKAIRRRSASVASPNGIPASPSYRQFVQTIQDEDRRTQTRALQAMMNKSPASFKPANGLLTPLASPAPASFRPATLSSAPQPALPGTLAPPSPSVMSPDSISSPPSTEWHDPSLYGIPPSPSLPDIAPSRNGRSRKGSLSSFKMPKILSKKRKDEVTPPLPPFALQPAAMASTSSIHGSPASPPFPSSRDGHAEPTATTGTKSIKKKKSFGQRIARTLSLSNLRGELDDSRGGSGGPPIPESPMSSTLLSPPMPSPVFSGGGGGTWSISSPMTSAPPTPNSELALAGRPLPSSSPCPRPSLSSVGAYHLPRDDTLRAFPPSSRGEDIGAAPSHVHLGLLTPSASEVNFRRPAFDRPDGPVGHAWPMAFSDRPTSSILAREDSASSREALVVPPPTAAAARKPALDLHVSTSTSRALKGAVGGADEDEATSEYMTPPGSAASFLPPGAAPAVFNPFSIASLAPSTTGSRERVAPPRSESSYLASEAGKSGTASSRNGGWESPPTEDDQRGLSSADTNGAYGGEGAVSDSDGADSDDVPLGQRHPDAVEVQKALQQDREARRLKREAKKQMLEDQKRRKRAEEEERLAALRLAEAKEQARKEAEEAIAKREAERLEKEARERAAARDTDDEAPLAQLQQQQRQRSKSNPPLRNPFAISAGMPVPLPTTDLSSRLRQKVVEQHARNGSDLSRRSTVGHALLPQTDASARSRKQSFGALEPLNPLVGQSVLTMWDDPDAPQPSPTPSSTATTTQSTAEGPTRLRKLSIPASATPAKDAPVSPSGLSSSASSKPGRSLRDVPGATPPEALKRSQTLSARRLSNGAAQLARGLTSKRPPMPGPEHITPFPSAPTLDIKQPADGASPRPSLTVPRSPTTPTIQMPAKTVIKVAIGDETKSLVLEIEEATKPADLLRMIRAKGQLKAREGELGDWAVFEVWRDLGLERPIREIEPLTKVMATWTPNSDSTFLLAKPSLIGSFAIADRAVTSGVHGGNLMCELRPGKWSKRYVVLRDNTIYLCANEKGKDEVFLCTLSNFDVFEVPPSANHMVRPPRQCAFGIKSLDKLSFFETKTDFVHYFCTKDTAVATDWMRRIYDARTFVIMRAKASTDAAAADAAARRKRSNSASAGAQTGLSRSTSTRKPPTTLIGDDLAGPFRQGTLLGGLDSGSPSTPAVPSLPSHLAPATTTGTRGWDKLGASERKDAVHEAEARARGDGRTLLNLASEPDPTGRIGANQAPTSSALARSGTTVTGGLRAKAKPSGGVPLARSQTLGR